ncbi:hypothetical protein Tco_0251547 [Tanacetum coccineum]
MSTPITTSTTDSQMHNNIMAAGSRDQPPMLEMGRYAQWQSRFLRYIDTRPNGDALRKCILEGPYTPSIVLHDSIQNTSHDMWITFERLQQSETLNIQDVKTNLFWEFGRFTSHDGETMESYYSRFYKMMNEMIRNNLIVATMQVNVQFLQQLQPKWSRFVTIVKQHHDLDTISYHKLFDILKQYQKEVNEICAEKIAKNANPLALRDKDMQKSLALISKYFKKIYQPTNNNLRTSSKSKNKNVDTSPREFGYFAKECRKPKRVKYYTYHKEKMLLCKQAEKGVSLQEVPNADSGTDTEPLEKVQYNAEYNVFANARQQSEQPESINNTCIVEKVDSNVIPDSPNMCDNDIQTDQNAEECDDERVALVNLFVNLTLDTEENKKILKQLKKANASLTQELKECKSNLEESNTTQDSCLIALQSK